MTRAERSAQFEDFLAAGPLSTAQVGRTRRHHRARAREVLLAMQVAGRVQVSDHPPSSPLRVWSLSQEPS